MSQTVVTRVMVEAPGRSPANRISNRRGFSRLLKNSRDSRFEGARLQPRRKKPFKLVIPSGLQPRRKKPFKLVIPSGLQPARNLLFFHCCELFSLLSPGNPRSSALISGKIKGAARAARKTGTADSSLRSE
jgi:hypothetical protein